MYPGMRYRLTIDGPPDRDGRQPYTLEWWRGSPDAHGRTYRAQCFRGNAAEAVRRLAGLLRGSNEGSGQVPTTEAES